MSFCEGSFKKQFVVCAERAHFAIQMDFYLFGHETTCRCQELDRLIRNSNSPNSPEITGILCELSEDPTRCVRLFAAEYLITRDLKQARNVFTEIRETACPTKCQGGIVAAYMKSRSSRGDCCLIAKRAETWLLRKWLWLGLSQKLSWSRKLSWSQTLDRLYGF